FSRDWSSDVCSSDLRQYGGTMTRPHHRHDRLHVVAYAGHVKALARGVHRRLDRLLKRKIGGQRKEPHVWQVGPVEVVRPDRIETEGALGGDVEQGKTQ